ncbi:MAG: hypothetical protein ACO3GM_00800 [Candidatus Limnocylindrus sp.]
MALITAAEARVYLPDLSGSGEDATLDVLIARASEHIARACGYPAPTTGGTPTMESTSYVRYYDPTRAVQGDALTLGIWPVTAVSAVYDDPDEDYGASTEVLSSAWTLVGDRGVIRIKPTAYHSWSSYGQRTIKVAFTAGYATIPVGVKDATARTVRDLWASRRTPLASTQQDPGRGPLASEVLAMLQPYRIPAGVLYQGEP